MPEDTSQENTKSAEENQDNNWEEFNVGQMSDEMQSNKFDAYDSLP
jgi:hypothetical protein